MNKLNASHARNTSEKAKKLLMAVFLVFLTFPMAASVHPSGGTLAEPSSKFMFWALLLGGFSALSLVLGSLLGIIWEPRPRLTAAFTAFGAGALLAALSIELIAPTVIEFVEQKQMLISASGGHDKVLEFIFLIGGCIVGGLLFYFLNEALNNSGGYLRKVSTTISYFNRQRKSRYGKMLKRLSGIKLFRTITPAHIDVLVRHIRHAHVKAGKHLFYEGNMVHKLYLIESGEVEILKNGEKVATITNGHFIGETAMLSREPASYSALAITPLSVFELSHNDFLQIKDLCPELQEVIESEAKQEFNATNGNPLPGSELTEMANDWAEEASRHLHHTSYLPTQAEINESEKKTGSAPLSIWLGIFLDGIPESFVIGAGFLLILSAKLAGGAVVFTDVIPYTLIAGLFLSNFPEAMSSTIGMKKMGWKPGKILILWTSLMLMTAIGAVFGYYYGAKIPNYIAIGVEGIASGAMLTMISQTMIPEAVHIGGNRVTGLSTLAGYLGAVAFKILE
jgi:CRP-like cAMP-binding protein